MRVVNHVGRSGYGLGGDPGCTPSVFGPSLNSYNIQLAAFTIASVPIGILVFVMMRYFVSGLSQSAIKL